MLPLMLRAAAGSAGGDGIPTDGLIAHYTMDNISGSTLVDEQGSYDGAITGAVAVSGKIANALSFNGSSDYVDLPINLNSAAGAFSFWLKGTGIFFSETKDSSSAYIFYVSLNSSNGKIKLRIKDTTTGTDAEFTTDNALTTSVWNHVVVQSNGSTYSVYLNGVSSPLTFTRGSNGGRWTDKVTNTTNTYLGKTVLTSTSYVFNGDIDQTRLYSRELTQDEITAIYNEG